MHHFVVCAGDVNLLDKT